MIYQKMMQMNSLRKIIAPPFYNVHNALKHDKYVHYWLKGGRGSTKSSCISIEIVLGIIKDPKANALVLRKVAAYLHDSVYEQLCWAIEALGVEKFWHKNKSPLQLTYVPTGQKILFRGADEPTKIKSTKVSKGYIKYIWYEETDGFAGMEEIRSINQSLMRGGEKFAIFYSFNPPKSIKSWVNQAVEQEKLRKDVLVHHSTYLAVPKEWLGEAFIIEAEHLKKVKPELYEHEYLGKATGTGGEIFNNVTLRKITEEEILRFDKIRRGLDWGYSYDPLAYIVGHIDTTRHRLYLFKEIYKVNIKNRVLAAKIKGENTLNEVIIADSEDPRSIADMKDYGINIKGAKKGPGSIDFGMKWLIDLEEIIIDPERCPNTAREFTGYELEKDKNGNFKSNYPDKDNHTIDATRYMLENDMSKSRFRLTILG